MNNYIRYIMPDPSRRRILLSIICVVSIYGLTGGFLYPLISLQMEARGFPPSWIGVMGAMPSLAAVIAAPITPLIMRTVNVSRLVFLSICADLTLILVMMFSDNVYVWFISRFLMGVAGSVLFVVSETWINEIADDRSRGQVLGLYTLTLSATFALSPLFIVFFGAEGSLPFLVAFIVIAFSLIPLRWTRGTSPDFSGGHVSHVWRFMLWAPTLVCAAALMAFEEAALLTLLPVYSIQNGVTEKVAALFLTVLAVGSMAAQPLIGWLADKVNRYSLIFVCALVVLLGALSLPFIIDTRIIVWPIMLVWGGAIAGIYTVALAIMGQRFRGAQLAAGNAAFGVMWGVAGAMAPGSAGIAMTIWGSNGFVIVMVIAISSFLLLALIRRIVSSN